MGPVDDIVEWYRGSSLRPYLQALGEREGDAFVDQVRRQVSMAFAPQPDGPYLLPFPRLFILARR